MGDDARVVVRVVGLGGSADLSRAIYGAEAIARVGARQFRREVEELNEVAWSERRQAERRERPGHDCSFAEDCLCFVGDQLVASVAAFEAWVQSQPGVDLVVPSDAATVAPLMHTATEAGNPRVFLDVAVKGEDDGFVPLGRLVFVLYADRVPRTCENFRALCTGEKGSNDKGVRLSYENSVFHRIQPGGWAQGGDIVGGSGAEGTSIYGETFADENFSVPHDRRGVLSMANKGLHTNASQFCVTFKPSSWMDTKFVAFGQLEEGSAVLEKLEALETYNQRPVKECKVTACGQL